MSNPIADLSYRHYEGDLSSPRMRWWVIARMSIRQALKKRSLWVMMALAGWYYLTMMVIIFFVEQVSEQTGAQNQMAEQFYKRIVWKEQMLHGFSYGQLLFLVVTLMVGAGAIANDNRANALLVYLSKPCSKLDYLFGKWLGVFIPTFTVMLVPTLVFYLYGAMSYRTYGFLSQDTWMMIQILIAMLMSAAFHSSLIIGISSLFNQGRMAGATYAGVYFLTNFFTQLIVILWVQSHFSKGGIQVPGADKLFSLSIDGVSIGLAKALLGTPGGGMFGMQPHAGPPRIPAPPFLFVFVLWALACFLFMLLAWRRIRAVEVVN